MDARCELRVFRSDPIRIFGTDNAGNAVTLSTYTVDVSHHGARVLGPWRTPGEIIGVRKGMEKARFKIVWVGPPDTIHSGHMGLRCVDEKFIWDIAPPDARPVQSAATNSRSYASALALAATSLPRNNRRKHDRFLAEGGVKVTVVGEDSPQWTSLHDISAGGCYVETTSPLPPDTRVSVVVHIADVQIEARGHVTVSHRVVGMGIQFDEFTALNRDRLQHVVQELAKAQPDQPA
ncbi:MAG TPA: PilZ domain-containing protein [Terriglobales bacterium]|nr:PilZ domain-containing protein [Terriglobales bacterium]